MLPHFPQQSPSNTRASPVHVVVLSALSEYSSCQPTNPHLLHQPHSLSFKSLDQCAYIPVFSSQCYPYCSQSDIFKADNHTFPHVTCRPGVLYSPLLFPLAPLPLLSHSPGLHLLFLFSCHWGCTFAGPVLRIPPLPFSWLIIHIFQIFRASSSPFRNLPWAKFTTLISVLC